MLLIKVYRFAFSPFLAVLFGAHCRFSPTCSEYAESTIRSEGYLKALPKIFKRILSCNPWEGTYGK